MKIIFKKIAKYKYKANDPNGNFEHVSKILNQYSNPPTLYPKSIEIPEVKVIYVSALNRAKKSVKIKKSQKVLITDLLNEIPFDINRFTDKKKYDLEGSKSVRSSFTKAFIKNELLLDRNTIFKQIEDLLENIKESEENLVGVISHSFRLKLIEAYFKTKGEIKNKPKLIHKFIKINKRTFGFGKGFNVKF